MGSKSYTRKMLNTTRHTLIMNISVVADSGAQMVLMGPKHAEILDIKVKEYIPAKYAPEAASRQQLAHAEVVPGPEGEAGGMPQAGEHPPAPTGGG